MQLSATEKKALGNIIRKERLNNELTQETLADASGLDVRTLQRVESGTTITMTSLNKIANVLKIRVHKLLGLSKVSKHRSSLLKHSLTHIKSSKDLVKLLLNEGSIEIGPPSNNNKYNDLIGIKTHILQEMLHCYESDPFQNNQIMNLASDICKLTHKLGFLIFSLLHIENNQPRNYKTHHPIIFLIIVSKDDLLTTSEAI